MTLEWFFGIEDEPHYVKLEVYGLSWHNVVLDKKVIVDGPAGFNNQCKYKIDYKDHELVVTVGAPWFTWRRFLPVKYNCSLTLDGELIKSKD